MRTLSSKLIILCSALLYIPHSYAMLTLTHIMQDSYNIRPLVYNQLSHKNKSLFRSVCKTWAHTEQQWFLMPDEVAQETDYYIQKHGTFCKKSKGLILFKSIYNNNVNAVRWILNSTPIQMKTICLNDIDANNMVTHSFIDMLMFAKNNDNKEIAQLLIKHQHTLDANQSWNDYYDKITPPPLLQKLLTTNDFTFLHYMAAVIFDYSKHLEQLFTYQTPTNEGIIVLINICFPEDSAKCFNFLATYAATHTIIKNNIETLKEMARKKHADSIDEVLEILYPTKKSKFRRKPSCIIQ